MAGTVGKNILALRKRFDLKQKELADAVGVTRETVGKWEADKLGIRDRHIAKMVELYGIEPDDIKSPKFGLHAQISGIVPSVPGLPNGFFPINPTPTVPIPVVDHVHAGMPADPDEADYIIDVPEIIINPGETYVGYIVDGDCMDKVYPEGCLIVIRLTTDIRNGSIGVFRIDGYQTVMRRVHRGANTLILSPESHNSDHKDIVISEDSGQLVEAIGTVVWFQAREELD